jgi:pectin methylesterase-like acyl-CoA thioesterase
MTRSSLMPIAFCAALFAAFLQTAIAATLCVDPSGSGGCYTKIQTAVNHASANDVINVKKGTYYEDVTIGIPLSLIGAGAHDSVINADGLANGIFVDGFDLPAFTASPSPDSPWRTPGTKPSSSSVRRISPSATQG